jgi:hypothetical protein
MKFPITREALQGFDIEKDRAERTDIAIDLHVNELVSDICGRLQQSIGGIYPKPNTIWHSQDPSHKVTQTKVMAEKRFIWDELEQIAYPLHTSGWDTVDKSVVITRLVQKLEEKFIGCDIIIDPLKRYLIIDWS